MLKFFFSSPKVKLISQICLAAGEFCFRRWDWLKGGAWMKFLISNMFVLIVIAFLLVTKLLQSQEDIILSGNAILIALPAKK